MGEQLFLQDLCFVQTRAHFCDSAILVSGKMLLCFYQCQARAECESLKTQAQTLTFQRGQGNRRLNKI